VHDTSEHIMGMALELNGTANKNFAKAEQRLGDND
jgi:hypothetical protein